MRALSLLSRARRCAFLPAGVRDWAAFLILYSLMVPISLYVSMELVRVGQSLSIGCARAGQPAASHRLTDVGR